MKIQSIQARSVDCGFQAQKLQTSRVASPMSRWPKFGERRSSWMWPTNKVFVRIESTDGVVGWSCTNGGDIVALIVQDHLSRLLASAEVTDVAEIWDQMFFSLLPCDRSGFSMMAISAVDIALWDLRAKTEGRNLTELLGAGSGKELAVYCTTPQPDVQADVPWWGLKAAMPFGATQGEMGLAENLAYMQGFRNHAGPQGRIMLDAFMAWDADYTLRFAESARDLSIYWIEDPLPPYDLEGLRQIRAQAGKDIRLALGNFCFNRFDCAELLREGLADILQPDVAWCGGITETLRILDMAAAAQVPVILHNTAEQPWALALAAACQTDAVVEFVDRGRESPLYGLMGAAAPIAQGRLTPSGDTSIGNHPPQKIAALFDGSAVSAAQRR